MLQYDYYIDQNYFCDLSRLIKQSYENYIKVIVRVCSHHAKNFVPLDPYYLAPLCYLFTNTLKCVRMVKTTLAVTEYPWQLTQLLVILVHIVTVRL